MFENWFKRHQNRTSLVLHTIGIPLTVLAVPAVVTGAVTGRAGWYILAGVLFVGGYALQFIGHGIEGNDAGEAILFKKLLGRPYVAMVEPPSRQEEKKY